MQARAHPHESRRTSLQSRPSAWRCPLPACQMQTVRSQPRLHFASDLGHSDQPKIQNPIAQRTRPAGSGSGDFPTPCGVRNSTREPSGRLAAGRTHFQPFRPPYPLPNFCHLFTWAGRRVASNGRAQEEAACETYPSFLTSVAIVRFRPNIRHSTRSTAARSRTLASSSYFVS